MSAAEQTDRADAIRREVLEGLRRRLESEGLAPEAIEKVEDLLTSEPADAYESGESDETGDAWRVLDPDQHDNAEILTDIMGAINHPTLWLEQDNPNEWRREGIAVAAVTFELWRQQVSR